ncbi:hypothetical protein HNQ59_003000 [Chitinivorax tropicus]|uniref:Secreted protein n=1 Tax=Chitinivorax tropicus TaxID=714531 RepID=A0A840MSE7_9PROT|nr:hypothetical protein [Chitinivorax tropicus]MBB5019692.1 hypothetical protein [Chitinivorax tropicus]
MRPIKHTALLVGTLFALSAGVSNAAEETTTESAETAMKVYRDPTTGHLREPEHDEVKAAAPLTRTKRSMAVQPMSASEATPQTRRTRSGGIAMTVPEDQMNYSVAIRKADGSLDMHCVKGEQAAEELVKNPAPNKQKEQNNDR